MAVLTPLGEDDARALAVAYGLGPLKLVRGIPAGSVNSNFELELGSRRYFLRLYEERDVASAEREAAMLQHLAEAGVRTPAPVARADGRLVGIAGGKPAALFPWLDGTLRCQASVTADDVHLVGEALATVHGAGAGVVPDPGRFRYEDLLERTRAIAGARDPALAAEAPNLRTALHATSEARDSGLPGGLAHTDLFRDNVLWDADGGIAALLDFESACADAFAYDLAVTMLAWCVGSDLDFVLAVAMLRGYESVRPLASDERRGLWAEACFAALRFTITRMTDYAMRAEAAGPRVVKDWRRFRMRFRRLQALGRDGFLQALT